jgi:hypothetical protein
VVGRYRRERPSDVLLRDAEPRSQFRQRVRDRRVFGFRVGIEVPD